MDAPATATADPAEPIEATVVDDQPTTSPEPAAETAEVVRVVEDPSARAANEAIVAATEAALAMPGMPGRDEFLMLAVQARMLSMSGAAPKEVQNNPHLAFHLAMVGRDLGISPTAALELIDVIPGRGDKPPQLSLSPQLINGQIRRLGLGSIVPVVKSDTRCVAVALGPDGYYDPRCKREWPDHHKLCECNFRSFLGETEFTWEQAQMAELAGRDCLPGVHSAGCKARTRGMSCNQGYKTYPQRMMWWRCAGFLADDIFPEASLGLYSPEALGAVVDEEGRPIDPTTVELPEGYEPAALPPAKTAEERRAEAGPPVDEDVLADMRVRVAALPEAQRTTYKEKWLESQRLRGFTLADLPADRHTLAESMLKGFESIAAREGWDPAAARAEVEATMATESPSEPAEGAQEAQEPDGATEPAEAPQDAPGDEGEAPRAGPDPVVAAWVREATEDAAPELIDRVAGEVKALHHASVNTELKAHGFEPEGQHIDTRRMVLAALRIRAITHATECTFYECDEPREPDGSGLFCAGHEPF